MKNDFIYKLKKAVDHLPQYEPEPGTWNKILLQLEFEDSIDQKIQNLPSHKPHEDFWKEIESTLDKEEAKNRRIPVQKIILYTSTIAASILLFVLLIPQSSKNTSMIISEEIMESSETLYEIEVEDIDPLEFINSQCQNEITKCNNLEFIEQKQQLVEIESELEKIKTIIERTGESPALIKSMVKMENMRSDIIKDLIKTLRS